MPGPGFIVVVIFFGTLTTLIAFLLERRVILFVLLFLLVFSNPFISIFSPYFESRYEILFLQAQVFYFTVLSAFLVLFITYAKSQDFFRARIGWFRLQSWLIFFFTFILSYFALGIYNNGFVVATVYLRLFLAPFAMLLIGFYLGTKIGSDGIARGVFAFGMAAALFVIIERFLPTFLYDLLNTVEYANVRRGTDVSGVEDYLAFRTRRFMNFALFDDIGVFRLKGPTFNYPSSSYVVGFGLAAAIALRRYWSLPIFLVGMAFLGTKSGVVFTFGLLAAAFVFENRLKLSFWQIFGVGCLYVLLALFILLQDVEVHSRSLIASVYFVIFEPLGRGLGFGGSIMSDLEYTWDLEMIRGDTGMGIALAMFGMAGLAFYAWYFTLLWYVYKWAARARNQTALVFTIAGAIVMFNSVLQELALGPYGMGFVCLILGSAIPRVVLSRECGTVNVSFRLRKQGNGGVARYPYQRIVNRARRE